MNSRSCHKCSTTETLWWKRDGELFLCNPCYKRQWYLNKRGPLQRLPLTPERHKAQRAKASAKYYQCHKDKIKSYFENRKELKAEYDREYRERMSEEQIQARVEYRKKNKEKKKEYDRLRKENKIKALEKSGFFEQKAAELAIKRGQRKLSLKLRTRFYMALKKNSKRGQMVYFMGATAEAVKSHIANKFLPGMTWENWGPKTWHIDHIRPLSSFDLTKKEDLCLAFHFSNLQPLWAKDNLKKRANYV